MAATFRRNSFWRFRPLPPSLPPPPPFTRRETQPRRGMFVRELGEQRNEYPSRFIRFRQFLSGSLSPPAKRTALRLCEPAVYNWLIRGSRYTHGEAKTASRHFHEWFLFTKKHNGASQRAMKGNIVCGSTFAHSFDVHNVEIRSIRLSFFFSPDNCPRRFDTVYIDKFFSPFAALFDCSVEVNHRNLKYSSNLQINKMYVKRDLFCVCFFLYE